MIFCDCIYSLGNDCTKIIIAQRISTTKSADKILVIQNGCVAECGTHDELVAKGGYYSELVKLQTGDTDKTQANENEAINEKKANGGE